jgi:site-specific DNA-methyltransferase (adenine-specific)/site-specific DNA-methyltransferase (cytosine-N4-specific)
MKPNRINVLYRANCAKKLCDGKLFPNKSIDLIVTSPPYANQRKSSYGGVHPKNYIEWFLPISKQLYRILKPRGSLILNIKENVENGQRQTYVLELILAMKKQGWYWTEEYCWYKKNCHPGKWGNRFRDSWERCLHFTKSKKFKMYQDSVKVPIGDWAKTRFKSMSQKDFIRTISGTNSKFGRNVSNWLNKRKVYPHNVLDFEKEHYIEPTTVIHFATACSNRNHSAAFPIELPSWFIKLLTKNGDIVLDPFIGIGTTGVAAVLLKRNYIGIEVSNKYIKEARNNIKKLKRSSKQKPKN